jgi:adenylate cyclase
VGEDAGVTESSPERPDESALAGLERELLGGERRYTRADVSRLAGVDLDTARTLWRALGFADVDDDNVAFTDRDVEALRAVHGLVEMGIIDDRTQVAVTRALGQSMARLAEWQLATITAALAGNEQLETEDATEAATRLVPVMERLIGYVWRRQLAASAGRELSGGRDVVAGNIAVGFVDLVGFTWLTRQVSGDELEEVVDHFEATAFDTVAEFGGRVIKTVGDEVMFAADEPAVAAQIAVALAERVAEVPGLPNVRIGVAYGAVVSRLGDVYGEPVNIASRLTSIARPGSVLVDRELATALDGDDSWRLRRVRPRPVRGYALLQAFRLQSSAATDD